MSEPTEAATTCPKCGAVRRSWSKYHVSYVCGTLSEDEESGDLTQSDACHIIAELRARLAEETGLLKRLLEWDHFDAAGDGAYWRKEITELLKRSDHVG